MRVTIGRGNNRYSAEIATGKHVNPVERTENAAVLCQFLNIGKGK